MSEGERRIPPMEVKPGTKRRIIIEVEIPRETPERLLEICMELCDFMESFVSQNQIEDYGLALEVPQYAIKELST